MWILAALALLVSSEPESWRTLSTTHFLLRYPPALERIARDLERQMEPTFLSIAAELGADHEAKILVVLAPDRDTFFSLQPAGVPDWASGTSYPERGSIYLKPLDHQEVRHATLPGIFAHELAHLVLHQRLAGAHAPRWLEEGIASRYGRSLDWDLPGPLLIVGLTGKPLPFSGLEKTFPSRGAQARLAYAQSTNFVGFLLKTYGPARFNTLLDRLAAGDSTDLALEAAFNRDLAQLSALWLRQVRWTYGLVGLMLGGVPLWFGIAVLGIWAYVRKRRTAALKQKLWELEDQAAALSAAQKNEPPDSPLTYH